MMTPALEQRLTQFLDHFESVLSRYTDTLPPPRPVLDWTTQLAAQWKWEAERGYLVGVQPALTLSLADLAHIESQKTALVNNTRQFLQGLPANHTLLTGARGCGKSSLIRALLARYHSEGLRVIEVGIDDLIHLDDIVQAISAQAADPASVWSRYAFILYCDDLSFELGDPRYKKLKVALEGSLNHAARLLIYASSNRRHLLPNMWQDNEGFKITAQGEVHESEAVEEKIALADRFGLWLSFHPFSQDEYLAIAAHWVTQLNPALAFDALARAEALRFALGRGGRSGRIARQFAQDWVGRCGLSDESLAIG